jgi:hypothetical protein
VAKEPLARPPVDDGIVEQAEHVEQQPGCVGVIRSAAYDKGGTTAQIVADRWDG